MMLYIGFSVVVEGREGMEGNFDRISPIQSGTDGQGGILHWDLASPYAERSCMHIACGDKSKPTLASFETTPSAKW